MSVPARETRDGPVRVEAILRRAGRRLRAAGIDTAMLDARLLLCHVLGATHADIIAAPGRALSRTEERRFEALLARRIAREPVAYILGTREFWGRDFEVTAATLIPRPDSETLISPALDCLAGAASGAPLVVDLGTGSGALLITVLAEAGSARGVGTDRSPAALAVARRNGQRHGVGARAHFVCAHWAAPLGARFDLVIANPPYVATGDLARLAPEIARYEPVCALDGGADGLAGYREIVAAAARLLRPAGTLLLETGDGQAGAVRALLRQGGFASGALDITCHRDLTGSVRCLKATMAG